MKPLIDRVIEARRLFLDYQQRGLDDNNELKGASHRHNLVYLQWAIERTEGKWDSELANLSFDALSIITPNYELDGILEQFDIMERLAKLQAFS